MEEQKEFNAQLSQKIHIVENSLNQKVDGLQSEIGQKFDNLQSGIDLKFDNLQCSISKLAQQHDHQEEESQDEECLSDTMVEEQCQQQLLLESSDIGTTVCPGETKEVISPMFTEESSGKDAVEGTQESILQPIPMNFDPNVTTQPKNSPLPVHILPSPATQSTPKTPAPKANASPSLLVQNIRKLVATVRTFATTSKTLAVSHTT